MKALIIAAAAAASLLATGANAQQAAAAPANPGPVIPGVCVYYNARLLAQSSAGQAVEAREGGQVVQRWCCIPSR